ncbi:MAG: polysaccharide biosynthesis protein PslG, partial [Solirubrobacteraceae bacterium]|nr:polysaccharide biosynthesis protein PslG [Solirubrobacteraceae bacterium]
MSPPANRCPRSRARLLGRTLAFGLVCVGALAPSATAASRAPAILIGFTDHATYQGDAASRIAALQHTKDVRARIVRITVAWLSIAPQQPPSDADAADPSWQGYRWEELDAVVRDVVAAGLDPLVSLTAAPAWAEGPNRPPVGADAPTGSWRPSPSAYGLFARAVAGRYSGNTPDPAVMGAALPRVRFWQAWNEPNLTDFLTPQWTQVGGKPKAASPEHYRLLNNAFYDGVKSVSSANFVVTAGTAPYGEPNPG